MKILQQAIPESAPIIGENLIINGDFAVNQRGLPFVDAPSEYYNVDRWFTVNGGDLALTGNIMEFVHTGVSQSFRQKINTAFKIGDKLTLSYQCRSNNRPVTSIAIYDRGGDCYLINDTNVKISTEFSLVRATVIITSQTNNIEIFLCGVSTVGSQYEIKDIKLEKGSIATPFVSDSYDENLRKCKYYFERIKVTNSDYTYCNGVAVTSSIAKGQLFYSDKRVLPTIISTGQFACTYNNNYSSNRQPSFQSILLNKCEIVITDSNNLYDINRGYFMHPSKGSLSNKIDSTNTHIDIDAEL